MILGALLAVGASSTPFDIVWNSPWPRACADASATVIAAAASTRSDLIGS
jgi:hypothetical protein